ncbi:hypothetical protein Pla22_32200 [Rubripirellula amarantea]|uniref:Uncharacterized protein n=1 Tax=Rubripirellula amarantea TaxID=2527999 RepID=A0A5C5WIS9_9BACT|nr:hypothetical protein [Rubripirellula amarantea]TWT50477.1 hypothetical protein Pla22_32200 [Rubripirellula amarantea]
MNAIPCPRCGDPVRVPPVEIPDDAMLRCTWCQETFAVAELNEKLPPMLDVLASDGSVLPLEQLAAAATGIAAAGAVAASKLKNGLSGAPGDDLGGIADLESTPPYSADDEGQLDLDVSGDDLAGGNPAGGNIAVGHLPGDEIEDPFEIAHETLVEDTWQEGETPAETDSLDPAQANDSSAAAVQEDADGQLEMVEEFDVFTDDATIAADAVSDDWPIEVQAAPTNDFGASEVAPMKVKSRGPRPQKKGDSPIAMVAKVIGGGLIAVPIGAAILTSVGKPLPIDLGFWPFVGDSQTSSIGGGNRAALPSPIQDRPRPQPSQSQRPGPQTLELPAEVAAINAEMDQAGEPADNSISGLGSPSANELELSGDLATDSLDVPDSGTSGFEAAAEAGSENAAMEIPDLAGSDISDPLESTPQEMELAEDGEDFPTLGLDNPADESVAAADKMPAGDELSGDDLNGDDPNGDDAFANDDVLGDAPPKPSSTNSSLSASSIEALQSATQQLDAALSVPDSKKQRYALAEAYKKIAEVASDLPLVPSGNEQVGELFAKILNSDAKGLYAKNAGAWIRAKVRKTDGILLLGKSGANSQGKTIVFDSGSIVSIQGDTVLPEGRVIALGKIVDVSETPRVEILAVESAE